MAAPTFVVQIFLNGSNRAVTADVRSIKIKVGRQRVLDSFTAGTCILALNNDDNVYGPLTGGTYGDAQWINAELQVNVFLNSASQPTTLFRGNIDDTDVTYPDKNQSVMIVKASDGLSTLARTELVDTIAGVTGNATFIQQVGSARFTAILDNAQVDYPDESNPVDRAIDTSPSPIGGRCHFLPAGPSRGRCGGVNEARQRLNVQGPQLGVVCYWPDVRRVIHRRYDAAYDEFSHKLRQRAFIYQRHLRRLDGRRPGVRRERDRSTGVRH